MPGIFDSGSLPVLPVFPMFGCLSPLRLDCALLLVRPEAAMAPGGRPAE